MSGNRESKAKGRLRRAVKIALVSAVALVVAAYAAIEMLKYVGFARPPVLPATPPILSAQVNESDGILKIGDCWIARKDGILRMNLQGDPFTLGYCNAVLTQEYIELQERNLIEHVQKFIPSEAALSLLKLYILIRNIDLPEFVSEEYQMELYGISRGYKDPFPEIAPLYHRVLNYHAAHDISHVVMNSPFMGCTSFAACGSFTENGRLLMARNFDFSAGRSFDTNKIVIRAAPKEGLSYISVAWPGMIGVVSGINEAHIAAAINASQSKDRRKIGTPVSLVMRRVMQYASTLDEAIDIIENSTVFVSDSFLLADGKTNKFVVVEKTPSRTAVRLSDHEEYIICSNHFLSDELKNDPDNLRHMREGTSVARYDRMEELVSENSGKLAPPLIAGILRDPHVPGGVPAGMGNASAINMLGATHSVIFDVSEGIIWVSAGPHQLGAYLPFSVHDFDALKEVAAIPPDPLLLDGSYERFVESEELISRAQSLLKDDRAAEAANLLERAERLNPDYYLIPMLLAKGSFEQQRWAEAETLFKKAQAHYPPYASERAEIENLLERIRTNKKENGQ